MQFKATFTSLLAAVLATGAVAQSVESRSHISFNNYGGDSSLSGFDNFYGSDNFIGMNHQTFIQEELICRSESIECIQQQLLVFQENIKELLLSQVCDVESQIVLLEQFSSGLGLFSNDLLRQNGRFPGYDRHISSYYDELFNQDGSFNIHDLGFSGQDLGEQLVFVSSNWIDVSSPSSVGAARDAARQAAQELGLSI